MSTTQFTQARWNIVKQRFDESAHAFIYYRAQLDYQHESQVLAMQNISEVLARGALLYPNYEEWGRIAAVSWDLAEAVVGDMPHPEHDDSYVPSPDHGGTHDDYHDTTCPTFFGIGEHMFTIEELFSEGVHITYDDLEQQASQLPPTQLHKQLRGPRRLFGSSVIEAVQAEVDEMTPITIVTSSAPPDVPSSSAPPAPRKTKKKGWRRIL
ncbi:hypothetical protein QJS10_CPA06g00622 [Acorus calamus]|uniref:Uncharacterized protein n=1 Tax=Acorus calamus TaxID=4465 RepID=A0AAV9EMW1_ACOCL|nr:hypothetical protein QJS10_CPA06g00622 [Acorus calamus]